MISITPISGMTLTTLIVTAMALSAMGLSGQDGMLQTLLIGGVVCTALSMTGSLVTQYKIGYWLGATPRQIEIGNLARRGGRLGGDHRGHPPDGAGLRLRRLGAGHPNPLPAPQPNAMAAVLSGVMGDGRSAPGSSTRSARSSRSSAELLRRLRPRLRARHVPADGAELAARRRRRGRLAASQRSSKDETLAKARAREAARWSPRASSPAARSSACFAALLQFVEDSTRLDAGPRPDQLRRARRCLAEWCNWLGLALFLGLAAAVYFDAKREKVPD